MSNRTRLNTDEIRISGAARNILNLIRRKHHILCGCRVCKATRLLADSFLYPGRREVRRKGSK